MKNEQLIKLAASVIKSKKVKGGTIGDVGCALVSKSGKIYTGICAGLSWAHGFCAEQAAISTMIINGEYQIKKIVAVWKDKMGATFVIPPCGNCRQFLRDIEIKNLNTEVVLDKNKTVKVSKLLPYHDSWIKQR